MYYKNVIKSVGGEFDQLGATIGEINTRMGFEDVDLEKATAEFQKFAKITGTDATEAGHLQGEMIGEYLLENYERADLNGDGKLAYTDDRYCLTSWMMDVPFSMYYACGENFVTVTPGVRFADGDVGDQKRVMTPAEAKRIGSDYIVVGRPITAAADPVAAYERCVSEFCD